MINTTTASLSALKAFATLHSIEIIGDKRKKASYVTSIDAFLSIDEVAIADHWEEINATYPENGEVDTVATTPTTERPMTTATTAALPLILMLGVTLNLVLWTLEVSVATAKYTHRKGRKTTAWKATNTYFQKLGKDISQFSNGLLYSL
jgi:hypothetical protein